MDTTYKNVMRIALVILYLALPGMLLTMAFDSEAITSCSHYGMAYAPYEEDCYFYIILDNGVLIEPEISSIPEMYYPPGPTRVLVGYEVIDSISSACGIGFFVYLTCIEVIDDTTDCSAMFTYERIRCDSIFTDFSCEYVYQFNNHSSPDAVSFQWDFGDGTTSNEENPVHEFPDSGSYNVCLTITTADGCSSQYCVTIETGTTPDCRAFFEYYSPIDCYDSLNDCFGSTLIQFVDNSHGNITEWFWDFGDGTASSEQNPIHEFPEPDEYLVCLSIFTSDGCSDTYCELVNLGQWDCRAYFEYCNYSSSIINDSIIFDTLPYDTIPADDLYIVGFRNLSEGQIDYYWWDFGDGGYSDEENPVHVYEYPGYYYVCLNVSSNTGCWDYYCTTVNVGMDECNVDFSYEIIFPDCSGFEPAYLFSPKLEGPYWSIYWDFGDGHYSYDEHAAHIYEEFGTYNVCVEVYYQNSCFASVCRSIVVNESEQDSVWYEKCNPNGITEISLSNDFYVKGVYPNPANNHFNLVINSPIQTDARIEMVNIMGQVQNISSMYSLDTGENRIEIDLSRVETGTYIYLIYSESDVLHGRINIIR